MTSKPNGVILYRGPSLLDGAPIVVVATGLAGSSANVKTGAMVQTWILSDDGKDPIQAIKSGNDASVCGDCPHRGSSCYVNPAQAPLSVYRAVQREIYPTFNLADHLRLFMGRNVRLGSYGDPAAVPFVVWRIITRFAAGRTGYTHQWRNCDQRLQALVMASCDTPEQRRQASAAGWRTFRIRIDGSDPLMPGEFVCPASAEAGKRLTCEQCLACSGALSGGRNASPAIIWHGPDNGAGRHAHRTFIATVARIQEQETRRVSLSLVNV